MRVVPGPIFAATLLFGVDTLATVSKTDALALVAKGAVFRLGYIDKVTPEEIADGQSVGLAFGPVTYALEFDGAHTVARLQALGIPQGVTVWLDVEGQNLDPGVMMSKIDTWAKTVQAAGYIAGLYIGAGCPLTEDQLQALAVTRYWRSVSRVVQPTTRQTCMIQHRPPNVMVAGKLVDVDTIEADFEGAVPTFAAA